MVCHWGRRSGTWSRGLGEVCTQLLLPALPSAPLQMITESQLGLTGSWVGAGSLYAGAISRLGSWLLWGSCPSS